jgi:hypothetical protein
MKLHRPRLIMTSLLLLNVMRTAFGSETVVDDLILVQPGTWEHTDAVQVHNGNTQIEQDHLEARFNPQVSGTIEINLSGEPQDWRGYEGLFFDVENTGTGNCVVQVIVESVDDAGRTLNSRRTVTVTAGTRLGLPFFFLNGNAGPYWGMRGIPMYYQLAHVAFANPAANINLAQVVRAALTLETKEHAATLRLHEIALFGSGSDRARLVPHPFIDAYGQFIHEDWPGKIHDDEALKASLATEQQAIEAAPLLSGMDDMGGWQDGPQLEATGWFRVEQVKGHWWFVTPGGRLFLSIGVNCVHYGDSTFIEGRDDWFAGLPDRDGPFAQFWGSVSGVHSMAEPIGGSGRVFNHYGSNLKRKFGEGYAIAARNLAYDRLRAWGFTTIGNWSDGDVLKNSPMPFTVTGNSGSARPLEGSNGYWGKMKDVFDTAFVENTNAAMEGLAAVHRDNPKVIGFFVDNEMSWSGIAAATLQSPEDQPARDVFIAMLQEQYPDIVAINTAWNTDASDWATLAMPSTPNKQCREDCAAFEYRFARQYFDTIGNTLKRHAPNHLYLGCRFTPVYAPEPALRACAEVVDVVSYNMYSRTIAPDRYCDFGKPVIFGEFHFGATDRGMFHTGLQAASDQNERAALYAGYIRSLAIHPSVIGAHWFKYGDQPTTGRTLDGENYNIGLVSIADVPYTELIKAAQAIHSEMYTLRYNAPASGNH